MPERTLPEKKELAVIKTTKSYVVCRKEAGMECEKEIPALLALRLGGKPENYYCVHRLDKAVGGVMVYARTGKAAAALSAQIRERAFTKEYLAAVTGCPEPAQGELQDYLYKDPVKGRAFTVKKLRRGVKEARLEYTVLETVETEAGQASLVRVRLHTGRFHQIRAQFAARQMPLLGDGKYGSRVKGCRVALFSCGIGFEDPATGRALYFEAKPEKAFPWELFAALQEE